MKLFSIAALATCDAAQVRQQAGPIAKVVKLLNEMLEKSQDDGEAARQAYAKFKCYCDKNNKEKTEDIKKNSKKVTLLENKIDGLQGDNGELSQEVAKLNADMAENEQQREEAQSIRDKAAAAFKEEKLDLETAISQMEEAIEVLGEVGADQTMDSGEDHAKFMAGFDSLLAERAPKLSKTMATALLAARTFLAPAQRTKVDSFLQKAPFAGSYSSQSGQVVGILKNMKDTFESNLEQSTAAEKKEKKAFGEFMETKKESYDKMKASFDEKEETLGGNDDSLSKKREQLEEAKTIVSDSTDFLDKLLPVCDEKEKEYNVRKLLRTGEETALAKAISIINNDAAADTFDDIEEQKKSFLQLSSVRLTPKELRSRRAAERLLKGGSTRLARIASLLQAGNPFTTVLTQIDEMLKMIEEEAKVDKEQKDWCISERESSDKNLADKKDEITNLEDDIQTVDELMNDPEIGLKDQIKTTEENLEENSENQKEETAARRDENMAYQKDISTIVEGEEAVQGAIEVLSKFYKSLEKHNEDDDDFIELNHTKHVKSHKRNAKSHEDPAPPETMEEDFEGQSNKGNEVIDLLKDIYENIKKQETRAHEDEEEAQHDYEDSMTGLKEDEADLRRSLIKLGKSLADAKKKFEAKHDELTKTEKEKIKIEQYLDKIKPGCDFVVDNFDERQENRKTESDALKNAQNLLKESPAYEGAMREAKEEGMGGCKEICLKNEVHAKCKACLVGVSVPGFCVDHDATPGC